MNEHILAELARLKQQYLEQLPAVIERIRMLGRQMSEAPNQTLAEELHRHLHTLAGSAGVHGLKALGEAARNLELQVVRWQKTGLQARDLALDPSWLEGVELLPRLQGLSEVTEQEASFAAAQECVQHDPVIWLVEGDVASGRELEEQLKLFNFSLRRFASLQAALAASGQGFPAVLLVDLCTCSQGCAVNDKSWQGISQMVASGCPLLVISGTADFQCRIKASRAKALGYFLKPLDYPALISKLSQLLERQSAQPARVLIIDDDQLLAQHYRLVLMAAGMEVALLTEAPALMPTLEAFRPELVLLDMHMPDFTGPELAGVIRQHEQWASLPLVYLSAETDFEQRVSALDRGGDDYLVKPISNRELVAAVHARIERARHLDRLIARDSLTGLLKHASIKEIIELEVAGAQRTARPASVVMLDIDHFKAVNDSHGHAMGDVVIASVATLLRQRLRKSDVIGRYGGEEFAVFLPDCDSRQAVKLLEDIRQHFATLQFNHDGKAFKCTLSVGIACTADHPHAAGSDLLKLADAALYLAKNTGRNRVEVSNGE